MRKISANLLFPVSGMPIKNGIIVTDDHNTIVDIIDTAGKLYETDNLEFYNGVLVPGFVNAHCHLELSYLKNKIVQPNGLQDFLFQFINNRNYTENREVCIKNADSEMQNNGIVAVGDISNTDTTFQTKVNSKILYHTFIEIFNPSNKFAVQEFEKGNSLFEICKKIYGQKNKQVHASIVPHAPYTVSSHLFKKIAQYLQETNGIMSIHNQETESENQLYKEKAGTLYECFKKLDIDFSDFYPSGKNSLPTYLTYFDKIKKCLLVHNMHTSKTDIKEAKKLCKEIFWVLCPFSNIFIENKIADYKIFLEENQLLCLGTDSLASNIKLSIFEEIRILLNYFPELSFNEVLKWATINGAKAINFDDKIGSFEIGKRPGINLIQNFDFDKMTITHDSFLKVIL